MVVLDLPLLEQGLLGALVQLILLHLADVLRLDSPVTLQVSLQRLQIHHELILHLPVDPPALVSLLLLLHPSASLAYLEAYSLVEL